jgi:hypothetical protein
MDGAAAMLWLWRAHNNVTSRLLAEQRAERFENPFKCHVHTRVRACVDDLCLQLPQRLPAPHTSQHVHRDEQVRRRESEAALAADREGLPSARWWPRLCRRQLRPSDGA